MINKCLMLNTINFTTVLSNDSYNDHKNDLRICVYFL